MSTYYDGIQMVKPFNRLNVNISCLGNHELDMGLAKARELIDQTNCPWILSNLLEKDKGLKPVCGLEPMHVLEHSGMKIGFAGFAEEAWTEQLMPEIECDKLQYVDYHETLKKYSKIMKEEHKCDLVVALNHMRVPDDRLMGSSHSHEVVDLIFGGHDHIYVSELNKNTNVFILKSGTDFECFSNLTILFEVEQEDIQEFENLVYDQKECPGSFITTYYSKDLKRYYINEKVLVTEAFQPDQEIREHVIFYTQELNKQLDQTAGFSCVDWEARFSRVRTEETNLGNFVADIMRTEFSTDFALANGGCLRANCVFGKGNFQWRFLSAILPMADQVVIVKVTGKSLREILENAISLWPKFDGRWPILSGIRFEFDPSKPAGQRLVEGTLQKENGDEIEMETYYTMASKYFMTTGKDGFSAFLDESVVKVTERDQSPAI